MTMLAGKSGEKLDRIVANACGPPVDAAMAMTGVVLPEATMALGVHEGASGCQPARRAACRCRTTGTLARSSKCCTNPSVLRPTSSIDMVANAPRCLAAFTERAARARSAESPTQDGFGLVGHDAFDGIEHEVGRVGRLDDHHVGMPTRVISLPARSTGRGLPPDERAGRPRTDPQVIGEVMGGLHDQHGDGFVTYPPQLTVWAM